MDLGFIQQFATALALSVLIGFERERNKQNIQHNISFAGFRSFTLFGVAGFLAFKMADFSMLYFGLFVGSVFALIIASYVLTAAKYGRIGTTTEIAAMLTFFMGGLCSMGNLVLAATLTLVLVCILYFKESLHKLAEKLKDIEVVSTIKFMIVAFVVLPLLPNQTYGPYGVFNPYLIWLIVVFVSGISFASYIAIKLIGPRRGIGLVGFLGGLISSTALTLSFSRESKRNKNIVNPFVVAIILASTAMCFRVLLELSVLNKELVAACIVPLSAMGFVGIVSVLTFWFWKDSDSEKEAAEEAKKRVYKLKSPFTLGPALKFGLFFMLILFVMKIAQIYFGHGSLYVVSLISGLVDVDAITVSVANITKQGGVSNSVGTTAVTLAVISNTLFKGGVLFVLGSRKVSAKVLSVFGLMALVALVSLFFF